MFVFSNVFEKMTLIFAKMGVFIFCKKIGQIFAKSGVFRFRANIRKIYEIFAKRKFLQTENSWNFAKICPFSHFRENGKLHIRFNPSQNVVAVFKSIQNYLRVQILINIWASLLFLFSTVKTWKKQMHIFTFLAWYLILGSHRVQPNIPYLRAEA
jgi:hypothetical protein